MRTPTVTYLIPLFGATWGALILHEPISSGMMAGVVVVLLSVALVNDQALRRDVETTSSAPTAQEGQRR